MKRLSKLQAKPFDMDTPVKMGSSWQELLAALNKVPLFGATTPIGFSTPMVPAISEHWVFTHVSRQGNRINGIFLYLPIHKRPTASAFPSLNRLPGLSRSTIVRICIKGEVTLRPFHVNTAKLVPAPIRNFVFVP